MDEEKARYKEKIKKEKEFYLPKSKDKTGLIQKVLHHPWIFSIDRALYNHRYPKTQMANILRSTLSEIADSLLIAPCGFGRDYQYIQDISNTIYGIDLSLLALKRCPTGVKVTAGDILQLPYPDGQFDAVVSTLFFHHLLKFGFSPFLGELHRVILPGGKIIILEPSVWYPLNIFTRPLKKLGNPFGEVEDEAPFHPGRMVSSLNEVGFKNIHFQAATFSHPSFYVPIANIVNKASKYFLNKWPFKYFGWLVVYWAEKS